MPARGEWQAGVCWVGEERENIIIIIHFIYDYWVLYVRDGEDLSTVLSFL